MKRRDALKLAGSAILAGAIQPAFAKAKAQKVLILGGTGFIGPHFVDALTAGGHKISLFNRGKREHEEKPGVEQLLGDRDNDLKSLRRPRLGRGDRQLGLHAQSGEAVDRPAEGSREALHLHLEHRGVW